MIVEVDKGKLTPNIFIDLVNKIWVGNYNVERTKAALSQTINICAWEKGCLVGCIRLLTDGYFYSTVTEILVCPNQQRKGIGRKLMEKAYELSPSSLSFGVQPGNEGFFIKIGFVKGLDSYEKRKKRS